jgi:uncharacterized delta-60 repeat protein
MARLSIFVLFILIFLIQVKGQVGKLDPSFGNGGKTSFHFSDANANSEEGLKTVPLTNGKVMVLFTSGGIMMAARLSDDGSIDRAYGKNGFSDSSPFPANKGEISADGKVLFKGTQFIQRSNNQGFYSVIALARINSDGIPDNTFGNNGVVVLNDFAELSTSQFGIQPDGKILIFGFYQSEQPPYNSFLFTIRLNPDGSFDSTFGDNGKVFTSFDNYGHMIPVIASILFTGQNKVIAIGSNYYDYLTTIIKFNPDGSPDNSFGSGGILQVDFNLANSMTSHVVSAALQPDGDIILGGSVYSGGYNGDLFLARLHPDGSIDDSFNQNGYLIQDFGTTSDMVKSILVSQEGKITVSGGPLIAARYLPTGTPDLSFGDLGKVSFTINGNNGQFNSVSFLPNEEILVTGTCYYHPTDCVVIKLGSGGTTDNTFNGDGIANIFVEGGLSKVTGLFKLPDGKLFCVGNEGDGINSRQFFWK